MKASHLDELSNSVPLSWILARRELSLRPVYTTGLDPAVWIAHAIEVEDPGPWLRGGELVLTTGLGLPHDADGQQRYVAGLAASGAAALGFGVGMGFAEIPAPVIAACRQWSLTLIEVPRPTPFVAVARAVGDRLAELRSRRLADVLDGQRALTRSASRGGAGAVARTLGRLLGAGVLVADAQRVTVARHGEAPSAESLRAETGASPRAVSLHEGNRIVEYVPFGPRAAAPAGWLGLTREGAFAGTDRLLVNHAASLLGLSWERPAERSHDAEHGVILRALMAGVTPGEVAMALGLPAGAVRVIAHDDPQLGSRLASRGLPCLHAPADFVVATAGVGWLAVVAAGEAEPVLAGLAGRAGVSEPVTLGELRAGWASAVRAFDAAHPGEAVWIEALGSTGRLSPAGQRACAAAVEEWLQRLHAYDVEHGADLVETLGVFLNQHGNADQAARELGCHRHTIRNRLAKVGAIAGLDLDDPSTRALLTLGLAPAAAP